MKFKFPKLSEHTIKLIIGALALFVLGYFLGLMTTTVEGFQGQGNCPNVDMSMYMLKTECPPQPDMSKYILKSAVPKCPPCISSCSKPCKIGACPPCPRPRCPTCPPCEQKPCPPCADCPRPRCPEPEVKVVTKYREPAHMPRPALTSISAFNI
jgi:hypothetical protein